MLKDDTQIQRGNIVTFETVKNGNVSYHTGIVLNVSKTNSGQMNITFGHNTADGEGKTIKSSFILGSGDRWDKKLPLFFKADSREEPDINLSTINIP